MNTSESKAFEELERLVNMKCKLTEQYNYHGGQPDHKRIYDNEVIDELIDYIIARKVRFIKKNAFSEISGEDRIEPMAALERLTAVKIKFQSRVMDDPLKEEIEDLLKSKIREVVWKDRTHPRISVLP